MTRKPRPEKTVVDSLKNRIRILETQLAEREAAMLKAVRRYRRTIHNIASETGDRNELFAEMSAEIQAIEADNRRLAADNDKLKKLLAQLYTLANNLGRTMYDRRLLNDVYTALHPETQTETRPERDA